MEFILLIKKTWIETDAWDYKKLQLSMYIFSYLDYLSNNGIKYVISDF